MESSKRALEAYKRTLVIDPVITDDDKVAPAYRFDEIAEMLSSSSSYMVREVVEYTMKRLNSKSPRVKQKVLRMIKFVVVKSGPEFKRQIQRQSVSIRQLLDFKGQPDPLRGDALNKAVRDTAREAISAIFASDNRPAQAEEVRKRIMGFGSRNYDMHMSTNERTPSTIAEFVNDILELGSASIRQGLSTSNGYAEIDSRNTKKDVCSYGGPCLTKQDSELINRDGVVKRGELRPSSGKPIAKNSLHYQGEAMAEIGQSGTSPEEKLLETITAIGGIRLQPTRESLQNFMASILKMDCKRLCYALESKLQSRMWQVRFKTLCVVETILHQSDPEFARAVVGFFGHDANAIKDCLQSAQTSVKDKALKVLGALSKKKEIESFVEQKEPSLAAVNHDIPNLIDTAESDFRTDQKGVSGASDSNADSSVTTNDLLGDWVEDGETTTNTAFACASFETPDRTADDSTADLFLGLSVENVGQLGPSHGERGKIHDLPSKESDIELFNTRLFSDSTGTRMEIKSVKNSQNVSTSNGLIGANDSVEKSASSWWWSTQSGGIAVSDMPGDFRSSQMPHSVSSRMPQGYQAPIIMPQNFGLTSYQQVPTRLAGQQRFNVGMNSENGLNHQVLTVPESYFIDGFDFSSNPSSRTGTESATKEDTKAFDFLVVYSRNLFRSILISLLNLLFKILDLKNLGWIFTKKMPPENHFKRSETNKQKLKTNEVDDLKNKTVK